MGIDSFARPTVLLDVHRVRVVPVQLVEVHAPVEVVRENAGVADTLQGGVHEARVSQVVQSAGPACCRHYNRRHTPLNTITALKAN